MQSVKCSKKVYCLDGLIQSINGILNLFHDLIETCPSKEFLLTYKLNQDPVENLFSLIRNRGGNNKNPSLYDFNHIIARLFSNKIIAKSDFSNCENDYEDLVQVEKQVFQKEDDHQTEEESICISDNIEQSTEVSDEDDILNCIESNPNELFVEKVSLRYFAGFILKKFSSSTNCLECINVMKRSEEIISLEKESERFIFFKNYSKSSDFGSLNAPTDYFFELCQIHINIFNRIINTRPEMKNIKNHMIEECVEKTNRSSKFSTWFSNQNPCLQHHLHILNYMLTILLRKNCLWGTEQIRSSDETKSRRKLKIHKE